MTEKDPTEPERRAELATFLRAHRTRILPTQLGIPALVQRRTPGLCDDVAALIGVGVTRSLGWPLSATAASRSARSFVPGGRSTRCSSASGRL